MKAKGLSAKALLAPPPKGGPEVKSKRIVKKKKSNARELLGKKKKLQGPTECENCACVDGRSNGIPQEHASEFFDIPEKESVSVEEGTGVLGGQETENMEVEHSVPQKHVEKATKSVKGLKKKKKLEKSQEDQPLQLLESEDKAIPETKPTLGDGGEGILGAQEAAGIPSAKPGVECCVSRSQVEKAVKALRTWLEKNQAEQKSQLLESDDMFYVAFAFHAIPPRRRVNGYRIPIPHSLYPPSAGHEICLFVKDSSKEEHRKLKKAVKEDEMLGVTKVMSLRKLRKNFKPYEAKRKLLGSYDLFLTDERITDMLPKLLGIRFFTAKKQPITVKLHQRKLRTNIRKACDSTYLYIGGGDSSAVRTARISQPDEQVVDNIMAVIVGAAEKIPSKWNDIRSIFIKTSRSLSLPVYATLPTFKLKLGDSKNS